METQSVFLPSYSIGGSDVYKTFSCPIEGAEGVHDLVFRFKGNGRKDLMNWDYWKFTE